MGEKAEEYAAHVVKENYSDADEIAQTVNLDERVDPWPTYRDLKTWLAQGYEAGRAATLADLAAETAALNNEPPPTKEYEVRWVSNSIDATSPEAAARIALDQIRSFDSIAHVFDVRPSGYSGGDQVYEIVDLDMLDNRVVD